MAAKFSFRKARSKLKKKQMFLLLFMILFLTGCATAAGPMGLSISNLIRFFIFPIIVSAGIAFSFMGLECNTDGNPTEYPFGINPDSNGSTNKTFYKIFVTSKLLDMDLYIGRQKKFIYKTILMNMLKTYNNHSVIPIFANIALIPIVTPIVKKLNPNHFLKHLTEYKLLFNEDKRMIQLIIKIADDTTLSIFICISSYPLTCFYTFCLQELLL